jgi:hypothetical protein
VRRAIALFAVAAVAAAVVPAVAGEGDDPHGQIYLVGGSVESINPTADMINGNAFFLGGYGFGSGRVANQVDVPGASAALGDRYAIGILGDNSFSRYSSSDGTAESDGAHSRAFAVSDAPSATGQPATVILAQIETQGYFSAYKQGPFGENEIRKDASSLIGQVATGKATVTCPTVTDGDDDNQGDNNDGGPKPPKGWPTAPVPTASQIVVDSNHSHGGPDTAGVWGGVPTSYLKLVHDQTVNAIVCAWKAMRPATLSYGISHAGVSGEGQYLPSDGVNALLHNQFSYDTDNAGNPELSNQTMDDEVRVFQAHDPESGHVIDTYVNFPAHPDVLGSSNLRVTGDYVGRLNVAIEKEFPGSFAMDQVSTLGREQPNGPGCGAHDDDSVAASALCQLDAYAKNVLAEVKIAADNAQPVAGPVAMNSYLLTDVTTSAVLAGVTYAGEAIGVPAARAVNAPWYTGTVLGTPMFVGRIGQVLVTGGPGEMYAQIWQKVKDTIGTDAGIQSVMNVGTAGDFLGYIIAPLEAYPCPAAASIVSGGCNQTSNPNPTALGPDPVGNDNYFFNISHTFGERLTCDFLRGAGDILAGDSMKYWSTYNRCAAFANDLAMKPGFDTTFPEQPDLSAVMPHI